MGTAVVFVGQYGISIDSKDRILVPMPVRKAIDPTLQERSLFMVVGTNEVPWFYTEDTFLSMVSQLPSELIPSNEQTEYDRTFAFCEKLDIDNQGRMSLYLESLSWAKFTPGCKSFVLLGCRGHLELHDKVLWEMERDKFASRLMDISEKARKCVPRNSPSAIGSTPPPEQSLRS